MLVPVLLGCVGGGDSARTTDDVLYPCATAPDDTDALGSDGPFTSIELGDYAACALAADGTATCWGCANDDQPDAKFAVLDLEYDHACGVTTAGVGLCWDGGRRLVGGNDEGQCDVPEGGPWARVSAGEDHTCAVSSDGCGDCWGTGVAGETVPPFGWPECSIATLDAGGIRTCFLDRDGLAECHGGLEEGGEGPELPWQPDGLYVDVSAGSSLSCVLNADGAVGCDRSFFFGCAREEAPPAMDVDVAMFAACLLLVDGSTWCWGGGHPAPGELSPDCSRGSAATVFGR